MHRNRKNIRLKGYDYSLKGLYFITICTKDRQHYFGEIDNQKFEYSAIGGIAYTYWHEIPKHFKNVRLGKFVIMPNHIHGIIEIVSPPHGVDLQPSSETLAGARHGVPPQESRKNINQFGKTIPGSISAIIGQFKSSVTRWCNKNNLIFAWQTRFYDHIIRNKPEYIRIEQYIIDNVANWKEDKFFN